MIFRRAPDDFRQHPALSVLAGLKGIEVRDAHQTVVIGSADPVTADLLRIELGAPIAECRCVVIDDNGVAIYVADIIYRSDAIKLHIDLLARSRVVTVCRTLADSEAQISAPAARLEPFGVAIDLVLRLAS